MAFGENWLSPIQGRLSAKFPQLTPDALDAYDRVCRAAMTFGHEQVIKVQEAKGKAEQFRLIRDAVLERHPWVTGENLDRLFSQGCYYAWKDGLVS